jgi:outer membrane protein
MPMKNKTLVLCVAVWAGGLAQAQDTRHTIDLGVVFNNLGDARVDGPTGAGVPPQASLDVGNVTAVLLNYELSATPNIGLQLATGIGGSFTVQGARSLAPLGAVFKADQFSATGFVNYHFFEPSNALRPFLGVGVNYTAFSSYQSYTGQSVELSNSWGFAAQGGARYAIDRHWSLVATLGLTWVKSDLSLSNAVSSQQASIDFRPVVVGLGVGYSF